MDRGIVEHQNDGAITNALTLAPEKGIDTGDDHIGIDGAFEDIAVELAVALEHPDDVQPSMMCAAEASALALGGQPAIGDDRLQREPGFVEVEQRQLCLVGLTLQLTKFCLRAVEGLLVAF